MPAANDSALDHHDPDAMPGALTVVRAACEALDRGDDDALAGLLDPAVTLFWVPEPPAAEVFYRGASAPRAWRRDMDGRYRSIRHQRQSMELVTDSTLLTLAALTLELHTGDELTIPVGSLWTARDGCIVSIEAFASADRATARARQISTGPASPRTLRMRSERPRLGLRLASAGPGRAPLAPVGLRPA